MAKDSRQRMVASAATLIGSRGANATSFSDVLVASRAPRGSIYHHFPGGKREMVLEAMRWTRGQVLAYQRGCRATTPSGVLAHFVELFRRAVADSQCRAGCPIAGVVVDFYGGEAPLIQQGRETFRAWTELLSKQFVATGLRRTDARGLAVTTLASVEGSLILCRTAHSVAPLDEVAIQLRRLAAAGPRTGSRSSSGPRFPPAHGRDSPGRASRPTR